MKLRKQQRMTSFASFMLLSLTVLVLSACSVFKADAVDDNVAYRGSKSVKALAIPPGMDSPDYDSTYAPSAAETQPTGGRKVKIMTANNGMTVIATNESPSAVWKRLEGVLPSMNMQIKQADMDKGVYTTVYTGDSGLLPRKGWLNRTLGLEKNAPVKDDDAVYLVKVGQSNDGITAILVEPDKAGTADEASRLMKQLEIELAV